jgi:hypothetical protein
VCSFGCVRVCVLCVYSVSMCVHVYCVCMCVCGRGGRGSVNVCDVNVLFGECVCSLGNDRGWYACE